MPFWGKPNIERMKTGRNVKGLIKALSYRKDDRVKREAIAALGWIGEPAVKPLLSVLEENGDRQVREGAGEALGLIGEPAIFPIVMFFSRVKEEKCREAAAAIVKIGEPAGRELRKFISGSSSKGRKVAVECHLRIGKSSALMTSDLVRCLGDKDPDFQKVAYDALVKIGSPAVEELIKAFRNREWKSVREKAARALADIGDPRAVKAFISILTHVHERLPARKLAANCLVTMYKSGNLSEADKHLILEHKERITTKHNDHSVAHADRFCGVNGNEYHHDIGGHTDRGGAGIDFSL